ncbi:MAG: leucine-rich repeat domain-containing protein [Clostridia bacterium]|nr:leucine-rich repeat domain-containing protein [Clostridia bacterium]
MQGSVYTKIYSDMGGVDFSGEPSEISEHRFAYLENMYRDYESGAGAGVETIPGFRTVSDLHSPVHAIHPDPRERGAFLVHAGRALYRLTVAERDTAPTGAAVLGAGGAPLTLADGRSRSTLLEGRLCLVDGERYTLYDGVGATAADAGAYVPTTYSDGAPYEQRNLLTQETVEEFHLFDAAAYPYESEGIRYRVTDGGVCLVAGIDAREETVIVPARVTLGGRDYAVAGIDDFALRGDGTIKTLILSEGITTLGQCCFFEMAALTTAVLPSTLSILPAQSFEGCTALTTLYLSEGLLEVGYHAFHNAPIAKVYFSGASEDYFAIAGNENIFPLHNPNSTQLFGDVRYKRTRLLLPVRGEGAEITEVRLDGATPEAWEGILSRVERRGGVPYLVLDTESFDLLYGKTLSLSVRVEDTLAAELLAEGKTYTGSGAGAIHGCRLIARYDGRLFLSGNPALPGIVFYTHRDKNGTVRPDYVGAFNRFTDGDGRAAVQAMTATPTYLLVLLETPTEGHSVFCHVGADTESDLVPRVYPAEEGAGALGCVGEACVFLDDTLFLSKEGLEAVEREALTSERCVVHRSEAVDARLVGEALSEATLFRYRTYLGIAVGGRVYLADGRRRSTRDGHVEYEWYYLSDIGVYVGQTDRYRYRTAFPEGVSEETMLTAGTEVLRAAIHPSGGYADGATVFSTAVEDGGPILYVKSGSLAYLVDTDGEKTGGVFSPATAFYECEGLLFFGTRAGTVCVFNTDKREEDGRIPRRYYTFNGRAYLSGCATRSEHCGKPHLTKSTVRGGGAVKLRAMTGGKLEVRVRTDREGWRVADVLYGGRLDYGETDFAAAEFSTEPDTVVPLREGARRWVEKQLYFVSEEYQRPFGIITVAYQYRVAGRIKA